MRMKVAILGANEPQISFFKQANKLGYEIHCFAWEEGAVCKEYASRFYPISFSEKEKVLEECKRIGINGILSFSLESALPTVNFIARAMNLEGNPEICEELTENKYTMREHLKKCGISVPEYICLGSEADIDQYVFKFPRIVKPIDSGGSRGVTKVSNLDELKQAYRRALSYSKSKKVLIEQFIEGREFSVEYISYHGEHYFVAITDKVTTGEPFFVELEHHQPAFLSSEETNKIKSLTERMLDALKIYSSASHTEIKMDGNGDLFVIEMGARMGGDMITSDLVRLSTGYDFVQGILDLATGNFTVPQFQYKKFSGVYYLSKESKYVLDFIIHADKYPQIVDKKIINNKITSIKESLDRSGYFVYQADKKFDLKRLLNE